MQLEVRELLGEGLCFSALKDVRFLPAIEQLLVTRERSRDFFLQLEATVLRNRALIIVTAWVLKRMGWNLRPMNGPAWRASRRKAGKTTRLSAPTAELLVEACLAEWRSRHG